MIKSKQLLKNFFLHVFEIKEILLIFRPNLRKASEILYYLLLLACGQRGPVVKAPGS